jgi:hypothetical protein
MTKRMRKVSIRQARCFFKMKKFGLARWGKSIEEFVWGHLCQTSETIRNGGLERPPQSILFL